MPFIGIGVGIGRQRFASGGAPAFDEDYQAVLDYATTQGYTLPSAGQQILQNQLVVDLKDGGIWSKLDTFANFATDGDSDFALIDWIRLSQYTAVNSPSFITNQGFKGDVTSSYINSNYNPSIDRVNFELDNASFYAYSYESISEAPLFGNAVSSARQSLYLSSINNFQRLNSSTSPIPIPSISTTNGMKSIHRIDSLNIEIIDIKNNTSHLQAALLAIPGGSQFVLRARANYNSGTISLFAAGSYLVPENDDFVDAFDTYINAL
jgi:hypothetical protein